MSLDKIISKARITKNKQIKEKSRKRRKPQRPLCTVIGTLESCILFLLKRLKLFKCLNQFYSFINWTENLFK